MRESGLAGTIIRTDAILVTVMAQTHEVLHRGWGVVARMRVVVCCFSFLFFLLMAIRLAVEKKNDISFSFLFFCSIATFNRQGLRGKCVLLDGVSISFYYFFSFLSFCLLFFSFVFPTFLSFCFPPSFSYPSPYFVHPNFLVTPSFFVLFGISSYGKLEYDGWTS